VTQRSGILAAGNWIVDHVKLIDTWPSEETLAIISRETQGMGGAPPNVLAGLARLGAKFPLNGAGIVGYDAAGDWILEQCAKLGIDTRLITRTNEGPTSYTEVMNVERTGRRTFFHQPGVNALLGPESIDLASCSARLFHLGYLLLLDRLDRPEKAKVLQRPSSSTTRRVLDLSLRWTRSAKKATGTHALSYRLYHMSTWYFLMNLKPATCSRPKFG